MAFWQVVIGRVIAGIGGAGMVAMVSVIITGAGSPLRVSNRRGSISVSCVQISLPLTKSLPGEVMSMLWVLLDKASEVRSVDTWLTQSVGDGKISQDLVLSETDVVANLYKGHSLAKLQ